MALLGHWHHAVACRSEGTERTEHMSKREDALVLAISAINNNPMLFTPFRDDHQIAIAMLLAEACGRIDLVAEYLPAIRSRMVYRYERRFDWVTCLQDYRRLAIHPARRDDEYFMCSTAGSILVPFVLVGLEHLRVQEDLEELQRIVNEKLAHVTKQVWVPHEGTDSTIWRKRRYRGHGSRLAAGRRGSFPV